MRIRIHNPGPRKSVQETRDVLLLATADTLDPDPKNNSKFNLIIQSIFAT